MIKFHNKKEFRMSEIESNLFFKLRDFKISKNFRIYGLQNDNSKFNNFRKNY